MKKYISIFSLFLFMMSSKDLCADNGYYFGLFGGADWLQSSNFERDIGYTTALTFGKKFDNHFRLEAELAYRLNNGYCVRYNYWGDANIFRAKARTFTAMGHVIYDIPLDLCIKPYFGVGVGVACMKIEHVKLETAFAWDMVLGAIYPLTDRFDLDIQYKKLHTRSSANNNSILLGLKYKF